MKDIEQSPEIGKTDFDLAEFLGGKIKAFQPQKGFRAGSDSVFLSAAVKAKPGQKCIDLGCGVGIVGLSLASRIKDLKVTGIEVNQEIAGLAQRNIELNNFPDIDVIADDLRNVKGMENSCDHVFMNPPFYKQGSFIHSPDPSKDNAIGFHDNEISLKDWIDFASRNLKQKGMITLIHKSDALQSIIRLMGYKFGALEIIPLQSKAGQAAKRVIFRAIKDSKSPTILHNPFVVHDENGDYTNQAQDILISGEGFYL